MSAAFSSDGQRVVTAARDGTARLWDASSGKPLGAPMKHDSWVTTRHSAAMANVVTTYRQHRTPLGRW
jgi:WD40 repeat protein